MTDAIFTKINAIKGNILNNVSNGISVSLTWKTVTSAQNRSSKFARAVSGFPLSFGKSYLPPNRFIPNILAVKMNSANRARKVMTLSIVWIITSSWRLSAGRNRTNLNILSNRNDRRTEIPLSLSPNTSTILEKNQSWLRDENKIYRSSKAGPPPWREPLNWCRQVIFDHSHPHNWYVDFWPYW